MAGRFGTPGLPDDTTGGTTTGATGETGETGEAGGTTTDAPGETSVGASSGGDDAGGTGGLPTTGAGDGMTDGASTDGAPIPPQGTAGWPSDQGDDGCSCITGAAAPWQLAPVLLAWRRRRRPTRP